MYTCIYHSIRLAPQCYEFRLVYAQDETHTYIGGTIFARKQAQEQEYNSRAFSCRYHKHANNVQEVTRKNLWNARESVHVSVMLISSCTVS